MKEVIRVREYMDFRRGNAVFNSHYLPLYHVRCQNIGASSLHLSHQRWVVRSTLLLRKEITNKTRAKLSTAV